MRTAASVFSAFVIVAASAACSSSGSDGAESQEGAYSQYTPGDAGDGGVSEGGEGGSIADEAPGVELDQHGMPKNKSINGFSFSGCEYWPFAVSASPYPDHIVWGCTPGSSPEAKDCMAAGMRRLAVILTDPPPQLLEMKARYRVSSFFNWNNDYYGAPEGRRGTESIYLYNGSLIKWRSGTNRDGTCNLPEKADLVRFLDKCLTGDATTPGC